MSDTSEERAALPSGAAIAGGKVVQWGPDPSAVPLDAHGSDADPGVLSAARALGIPDSQIASATQWWANGPRQTPQELAELDDEHAADAADELRALYGDSYFANLRAADRLINSLPGNAGEILRNARDADGRALLNTPTVIARLVGAANARKDQLPEGDVAEQIAAIEKVMRSDRTRYVKDELMQQKYRELLSLRK